MLRSPIKRMGGWHSLRIEDVETCTADSAVAQSVGEDIQIDDGP